ncbi:MAG TPA: hypothetical protein VJK04_03085 [Candidatus Paceibacterota bacterium]
MTTTLQFIFVIFAIIVLFMFLPNILTLGFDLEGVRGTLSQISVNKVGQLAISYDGGETFKSAGVDAPGTPSILTINAFGGKDGAAFSDRTYYAGTDQGILISKDNGLTWHSFVDLEKNIDAKTAVNDFAFNPNTGGIFAAAYKNGHGVVYATDDNFFTVSPIWTEARVKVLSLASDNNFLYLGLMDGRMIRYDYAAKTFQAVKNFDSGIHDLNLTNGGKNIFVSLLDGNMYSSEDFGVNWSEINTSGEFAFFLSGSSISLTPDLKNTAILYSASTAGIFRSVDRGTSWDSLNTILPKSPSIASFAVQNGRIYVTIGANLYASADGGVNWKVEEPMPISGKLGPLYVANNGQLVIVGVKK